LFLAREMLWPEGRRQQRTCFTAVRVFGERGEIGDGMLARERQIGVEQCCAPATAATGIRRAGH